MSSGFKQGFAVAAGVLSALVVYSLIVRVL